MAELKEAPNSSADWSPTRCFEELGTQSARGEATLRVVTLNCLSSAYVNHSQLSWCPPEFLSWSHRQESLFDAVRALDPTVLCLQEADHVDEWKGFLEPLGFKMSVAIRPTRQEGCVTAWKANTVELVGTHILSFNDLAACNGGDVRFLRDNVALITRLQSRLGGNQQQVLLANTHLYWNPHRPEVKIAQAEILARTLELMAGSSRTDASASSPVCIVGDLNSLPGSDVIKFLELGEVERPMGPKFSSRFICDMSLNRLCRWLRILGLDCELETEDENVART